MYIHLLNACNWHRRQEFRSLHDQYTFWTDWFTRLPIWLKSFSNPDRTVSQTVLPSEY